MLGKFESQVIAVRFHPDSPLVMHAEAFMEMEMGPTEIITIDAKASNLAYCLDKVHVEFGSLLFCETACQSLRIQNTGLLGFDFETNTADSVLYDGHDYPVETGILIITPKCGHVPPSSDVVLLVRYHPNAPGKFEERFQLTVSITQIAVIRIFISESLIDFSADRVLKPKDDSSQWIWSFSASPPLLASAGNVKSSTGYGIRCRCQHHTRLVSAILR